MSKTKRATAPRTDITRHFGGPRVLAKRMLKGLLGGDAWVVDRFEQFHPRYEAIRERPKLADAQLVVARMFGYRSWPQLKRHRETIVRCQREIDSGAPAPDRDLATVHVRCGSDIQPGLGSAGYAGSFVEFADPLCQGPVPAGSREALIHTRAAFIAHAYELKPDQCRSRLLREWAALEDVGRFDRVVLWFEHDSYDQLVLAAVLATLADLRHRCVELICIEEYPGRPRFRGLGELGGASLRGLWDSRRPVGREDYELGIAVWEALRLGDPRPLFEIALSGTPRIPAMAGALRRHLMELPWTSDGLSLTQRIALEAVRAGMAQVGAVFRVVTSTLDPLPFLGDEMFWWEVRELAAGGAVSLTPGGDAWSRWGVALTELGEALLRGTADWVREGGRTRWLGGVRCGLGGRPWRWDASTSRPTSRA